MPTQLGGREAPNVRMGCPCAVKSETAGEELNERHRGSRFGGNKGQPAWEAVTDGVDRLPTS
jgi:hypothetical protein